MRGFFVTPATPRPLHCGPSRDCSFSLGEARGSDFGVLDGEGASSRTDLVIRAFRPWAPITGVGVTLWRLRCHQPTGRMP